jgi:DNA polymerase-3 subunit delta'
VNVFNSLIDQSEVVEILKEAVKSAQKLNDSSQVMTNTWLFTGPPGSD